MNPPESCSLRPEGCGGPDRWKGRCHLNSTGTVRTTATLTTSPPAIHAKNARVRPPARTICHTRAMARAATSPEYKKITLIKPQEKEDGEVERSRPVAPPYKNMSGTIKKLPSDTNSWVVTMARTMTLSAIGLKTSQLGHRPSGYLRCAASLEARAALRRVRVSRANGWYRRASARRFCRTWSSGDDHSEDSDQRADFQPLTQVTSGPESAGPCIQLSGSSANLTLPCYGRLTSHSGL